MDNRLFLSVLLPAASAGSFNYSINAYAYDSSGPDNTITGTVTGILTSYSETQVAQTIFNQVSLTLISAGASYSGAPFPVPNNPLPTFRLTRTEHVICFWSQAQFEINITGDTTGGFYAIDATPTLDTVAGLQQRAFAVNQPLQSDSGGPLTTLQLVQLLRTSSAELVNTMRNNIVLSTYYFETWTNFQNQVRLQCYPVAYLDTPYILRPTIITNLTLSAQADTYGRYFIDSQTGWVAFRFTQDLLFNYEPYDINNQWRVTYIAGFKSIPSGVKDAIAKLSYQLQIFSNLEEIRGGSFVARFDKDATQRAAKAIYSPLRQYFLEGIVT
jgi:hypothetical protein